MFNSTLPKLQEGNTIQDMAFHKIFESQTGLILILSPQLTIQGATDAYLQETLTARENVLGKHVFDVFPDNPDSTEASPTLNLKKSLEQVLSTGRSHEMDVFRYDIPDPDNQGSFIERYWSTINTPLLDEQGKVTCIIHETINVSEARKASLQLEHSQQKEKEAMARAEQQRLRLERFFEQAPAACAMVEGPDFVFKVINKSYQQIFPGRKLLGMPVFEAFQELKAQPIYDLMRRVYNTGETFEGKEILVSMARYEGQPLEDIYFNFIYQALFDAQGQVTGILIFALDVTDFVEARHQVEKSAESLQALNQELEERIKRRTLELQLAQGEAERQSNRLDKLFKQAPAAICILEGPDLMYKFINPTYQQLFPNRQLLGKPILEALPEIEHNAVYTNLQDVYATGKTHEEPELLIPIARPEDGVLEDRYFKYVLQPQYNEEGQVNGVIVFALEMTEQVEARKAVEASEQQLRLITDSLPVLIGYLDKHKIYRFANKAYDSWFDLKGESMVNKPLIDIVGEKVYNKAIGYIERALTGERLSFDAAMEYREGLRHIHTDYIPDVRGGEIKGFYTLITDATEQVLSRKALEESEQEAKMMAEELAKANDSFRLANEELGKANQRLTHINADLDNFVYTASHDLKAPISNIEMLMEELLVELPEDSLENDEIATILGMMKGSVARFKKTIASLTEISKVQKDEFNIKRAVAVGEVVEEVRLDLEQIILKSGAIIETEMDDCATVPFSEKNLRSIVYNLLSNSIKYRHPGRDLFIKVSCQQEGEHVVLKVQDNGLGLNAEQQGKLFSMFKRFHDHVEGSGVGLYMVKRIVDNAGAKILVESETGVGSTFSVYFKK